MRAYNALIGLIVIIPLIAFFVTTHQQTDYSDNTNQMAIKIEVSTQVVENESDEKVQQVSSTKYIVHVTNEYKDFNAKRANHVQEMLMQSGYIKGKGLSRTSSDSAPTIFYYIEE